MTARVLKAPEVTVSAGDLPRDGIRAALAEAFAQGRAQGSLDATAGLEHQLRALREKLAETAEATSATLAAGIRLDAELVTTLAADLAAWFLDAAIEVDAGAVVDGLRRAMGPAANEPGLVLHAAPAVARAIGEPSRLGVQAVRPDPELAGADFVLMTETTVIERRFRDAIDEIRAELVAAIGSVTGDG